MPAWTFEAIGTGWQIDTPTELASDVRARITALIDEFDRRWSRFRSDSVISRLATSGGEADFGADGTELFDLYDTLAVVTDGALTPLVGRTLADLGYDADYSLRPANDPARVGDWSQVRRCGAAVSVEQPTLIDVGAAGKGLLVDRVAAALRDADVAQATVDAGGDIHHRGDAPIRVGLEHPADPGQAIGVVTLDRDEALCGSAGNRRAWGPDLHHLIDGRTGRPTFDVVATWVMMPGSCMLADGLETAHFFADPDELTARWPEHRFVRIGADGRVTWSPTLRGEIFRR